MEFSFFDWELYGQILRDHFASKPYKSYALELDIVDRFSDNAFLLLPDDPVVIELTPKDKGVSANFALRDLHTATKA